MKKSLSLKIVVVLAILTVICLIVAVLASQKMSAADNDLTEERFIRMVAEEKLEQIKSRVGSLEGQLEKISKEKVTFETLLQKEKKASDALKLDLEKARRLNEVLQRELQNALVTIPEPVSY